MGISIILSDWICLFRKPERAGQDMDNKRSNSIVLWHKKRLLRFCVGNCIICAVACRDARPCVSTAWKAVAGQTKGK